MPALPAAPTLRPHSPPARRREAGFSLAEVVVTLAVTVLLAVSLLTVFDFNNRLSRVQSHIADLQQSLRSGQYLLVRQLRMAGRGGMPQDKAIVVRNNVGLSGSQGNILVGVGSSPLVARGTDVITMRGVVSTPLYQINYNQAGATFTAPGIDPGKVVISDPGPSGVVHQDLDALQKALSINGTLVPDAMIMVSPSSDAIYAVVEITSGNFDITYDGSGKEVSGTATLSFQWTGGRHTDAYQTLYNSAGGFPLSSVATVGILEEYRYYIHDVPALAGAVGSASNPVLSTARVIPGSELAYRDDSANYLQLDIADGVVDLQVALGIDANGDGVVTGAPNPPASDEWLYDDPGDVPLSGPLEYVRVSLVARTQRPDSGYNAPPLAALEDHDYNNPPSPLNAAGGADRHYRRRVLQAVIDVRNLG